MATKTDICSKAEREDRLKKLRSLFGIEFTPVSAQASPDVDFLKETIDRRVTSATSSHGRQETSRETGLTVRHRQTVTGAIENISKALEQVELGNEEVAAMYLRTTVQSLSQIHRHDIDENILDRIFSAFCVGK